MVRKFCCLLLVLSGYWKSTESGHSHVRVYVLKEQNMQNVETRFEPRPSELWGGRVKHRTVCHPQILPNSSWQVILLSWQLLGRTLRPSHGKRTCHLPPYSPAKIHPDTKRPTCRVSKRKAITVIKLMSLRRLVKRHPSQALFWANASLLLRKTEQLCRRQTSGKGPEVNASRKTPERTLSVHGHIGSLWGKTWGKEFLLCESWTSRSSQE